MQISSVNFNGYNYYNISPQKSEAVNFGAAKDINLRYILEKRSHLLPERVLTEARDVVKGTAFKDLPTLKDLHEKIYKPLMNADSLKKVETIYPEFSGVVDFATVADRFPRLVKIIQTKMPLADFSLDCLKKVWSGMPQEEIAKAYGFSGRGPIAKLCENLNIPKPDHNYLTLLKNSDEAGNQKTAEATRRHLDVCMKNLALATIASKTPEARAKHAVAIVRHYQEHPEKREEVSKISKLAWEKCPQIREAKTKYFMTLSSYQRCALRKQEKGGPLTAQERRVINSVHKQFWDEHPDFKAIYSDARREAAREVKLSALADSSCDVNA